MRINLIYEVQPKVFYINLNSFAIFYKDPQHQHYIWNENADDFKLKIIQFNCKLNSNIIFIESLTVPQIYIDRRQRTLVNDNLDYQGDYYQHCTSKKEFCFVNSFDFTILARCQKQSFFDKRTKNNLHFYNGK